MSGRSPPLYCTLILITMRSHQSYHNITTVIHSYEYSIVLLSIIVPSRHTGIGAWVNSKLYTTSILYNLILMQGYLLYKHRIHRKLGLQLSFRWVFKEKSNQMYPVMGEKQMSKRVRWDQRLQNF